MPLLPYLKNHLEAVYKTLNKLKGSFALVSYLETFRHYYWSSSPLAVGYSSEENYLAQTLHLSDDKQNFLPR